MYRVTLKEKDQLVKSQCKSQACVSSSNVCKEDSLGSNQMNDFTLVNEVNKSFLWQLWTSYYRNNVQFINTRVEF